MVISEIFEARAIEVYRRGCLGTMVSPTANFLEPSCDFVRRLMFDDLPSLKKLRV